MKKLIVTTVASIALAGALSASVASAHPNTEPTPPPTPQPGLITPGALLGSENVNEEGDHQSGDQGATDATTGAQSEAGQMGEKDADVDEQSENKANTTTGTQVMDAKSGHQQDGNFDGEN